jgi:uncharacterized protein YtpQ (UPF0354 family)
MSQDNLTKKQFTKEYLKKSIEINPDIDYRIVDELHLVSTVNDKDFQHFLDNAYAEYKLDPSDLDAVLVKYIHASDDLYEPADEIDNDRIVPVIKDKNYIADVEKSLSVKGGIKSNTNLVYEKYNDELIIVFAEDQETSIKYFSKDDFDKTGLVRDSLRSKSVENLKQILPDIQSVGDSGLFGLLAGGDYEASLILFESIWTKDNFDVKGDIVIAIPTRDLLFVTGSLDSKGLDNVRENVKEAFENGSYFLTTKLFKWTGKKFEVFDD